MGTFVGRVPDYCNYFNKLLLRVQRQRGRRVDHPRFINRFPTLDVSKRARLK